MPFICNKCSRPIASRKHNSCGYCGEPLAEDQMMTDAEKQKLDSIKADDKKRHRRWKEENPGVGSGSVLDDL